MTKEEKTAYKILAAIYPDKKPSEVRQIVEEALNKKASNDDVELWAIIVREFSDDSKKNSTEPIKEKIIEKHFYHDGRPYWYGPYYYNDISTISTTSADTPVITCGSNGSTIADSSTIELSSNSISDVSFDSITFSTNMCSL